MMKLLDEKELHPLGTKCMCLSSQRKSWGYKYCTWFWAHRVIIFGASFAELLWIWCGQYGSNPIELGSGHMEFQVLSSKSLEVHLCNLNLWEDGSWDFSLHMWSQVLGLSVQWMDAYMATFLMSPILNVLLSTNCKQQYSVTNTKC